MSLCLLSMQNVTLKRDWQCCKMDELWEHGKWKNPITKDHILMWFHLYEMYKKGTFIEISMEENGGVTANGVSSCVHENVLK